MKNWNKLKLRILATFLCFVMVVSQPAFLTAAEVLVHSSSNVVNQTAESNIEDDTLLASDSNSEEIENNEDDSISKDDTSIASDSDADIPTLFEAFIEAATVTEMRDMLFLFMEERMDELMALTAEEIYALQSHAMALPAETEEEFAYQAEIVETLSYLPNGGDAWKGASTYEIAVTIEDTIKADGKIKATVTGGIEGAAYTYKWYKKAIGASDFELVESNDASDRANLGDNWLNVVYDNEVEKSDGTFELQEINGLEYYVVVNERPSAAVEISDMYISIQNGGFEDPKIATYIAENETGNRLHQCFPKANEMPHWGNTAAGANVGENGTYELVTSQFFDNDSTFPDGINKQAWMTYGVGNVQANALILENGIYRYDYAKITAADDAENGEDTNQFMELNAGKATTVYQSVLTSPGATLNWQFAHRSRLNVSTRFGLYGGLTSGSIVYRNEDVVDSMYLVIMSDEAAQSFFAGTSTTEQQEKLEGMIKTLLNEDDSSWNDCKDKEIRATYLINEKEETVYIKKVNSDASGWHVYNGTYEVPEDQFYTRFFYVPGSAFFDRVMVPKLVDKNGVMPVHHHQVGNLVDAVHFSAKTPEPILNHHRLNIKYQDNITKEELYPEHNSNIQNGQTYSVNSPTIIGYTLTNPADAVVSGTMGAENIQYTVYYTPDPAKIMFEENGGTEVADMDGVTNQVITDRTMPITTRDGYEFLGWYEDEAFSGIPMFELPSKFPIGITVYYAKWVKTDGSLHSSKTLDGSTIKLEAWTEGTTHVVPTEVVMVMDQSGSMLSTVDGNWWNYTDFKKCADPSKGEYPGYYMATAKNAGKNLTGTDHTGRPYQESGYNYALVMIRYDKEQERWERSSQMLSRYEDYRDLDIYLPFNLDKLGLNSMDWTPIDDPSGTNYVWSDDSQVKYYKSIYGAAIDGMNAFLDEAVNIPQCKIAVIGFSTESTSTYGWDPESRCYMGGTGIFVNGEFKARSTLNDIDYTNAFLDSRSDHVTLKKTVKNVISNYSNTYTQEGLYLAKRIFDANPSTDTNRIVILFTDGLPTGSIPSDFTGTKYSYDRENPGQNGAIAYAKILKDMGIQVYAIGQDSRIKDSSFLKYISSDYPDAVAMDYPGTEIVEPKYYDMATQSTSLETKFAQIAQTLFKESLTLNEKSVIKDVITPYFELNGKKEDITVWKVPYLSGSGDNVVFDEDHAENITSQVKVTVNGQIVEVEGYNFAKESLDTQNGEGYKLQIRIPIKAKDEFLGGNHVPTNTAESGIYDEDENAIKLFDIPETDVPIKEITVKAPDKNVYLLGSITPDQLKTGLTVECENVVLDLSPGVVNYGLADWQHEFARITTDKDEITQLNNLSKDQEYEITVTITPKTTGTATYKTGTDIGRINVFKPVLTYKDSEVYYGGDQPASYDGNLEKIEWKHGDTFSTSVEMTGTAPNLNPTYKLVKSGDVKDGKINTKKDIPVNVTSVKLEEHEVLNHTTFIHTNCEENEDLQNGKFLLHPQTVQLTVTKSGGADNEPYVFNVMKKNGDSFEKYTELSITGNGSKTLYELPVGTYTIEENKKWSWRYNPTISDAVTLNSEKTEGTITCTNEKVKRRWFNGFSQVVANIFGTANAN